MMWYCLHLQTKLGISSARCYDVVSANPTMQFVANGMAPKVPPGALPASLAAFNAPAVSIPGTGGSSPSAVTVGRAPSEEDRGRQTAGLPSEVVPASSEKSLGETPQPFDGRQQVPRGAATPPAAAGLPAGASDEPAVSPLARSAGSEDHRTDGSSVSSPDDGGATEQNAPAESLARVPPLSPSGGVDTRDSFSQ